MIRLALCLFVLFISFTATFGYKVYTAPLGYPLERDLTNNEGRTISATIISKQGEEVIIRRNTDSTEFVLSLGKLSSDDQAFIRKQPDDPGFGNRKEWLLRPQKTNRKAVWHRDLQNARREAERTELPIVLAFLQSGNDDSRNFDRDHLSKPEFRDWANRNAVLCLYYNDPTIQIRTVMPSAAGSDGHREVFKDGVQIYSGFDRGEGLHASTLNGISTKEGQKLSREYGIVSAPVLVVLNKDGKHRGKFFPETQSTVEVINGLEALAYPAPNSGPLKLSLFSQVKRRIHRQMGL